MGSGAKGSHTHRRPHAAERWTAARALSAEAGWGVCTGHARRRRGCCRPGAPLGERRTQGPPRAPTACRAAPSARGEEGRPPGVHGLTPDFLGAASAVLRHCPPRGDAASARCVGSREHATSPDPTRVGAGGLPHSATASPCISTERKGVTCESRGTRFQCALNLPRQPGDRNAVRASRSSPATPGPLLSGAVQLPTEAIRILGHRLSCHPNLRDPSGPTRYAPHAEPGLADRP